MIRGRGGREGGSEWCKRITDVNDHMSFMTQSNLIPPENDEEAVALKPEDFKFV